MKRTRRYSVSDLKIGRTFKKLQASQTSHGRSHAHEVCRARHSRTAEPLGPPARGTTSWLAAPTTIRAFVQPGMQTTFRFAPGYLLSFPCSATWVIFKYLSRNAIQLRAVLLCSGCARTLANHQQHGRRVWECATTMPSQWSSLPREKTAEGVATQGLQRPCPRIQ